MKVIISHDVDHLYPSDHVFRDLIFPKLWLRSLWHVFTKRITFKTCCYRFISIFGRRLHQLPEIMSFDKAHRIPSVFFFGMANGLGMSYRQTKTDQWIQKVLQNGFDAGVHGIDFQDIKNMKWEHDCFQKISKLPAFGIRMHYVRYDNTTFQNLSDCGYLFDSTEFNKKEIEVKAPYKVNNMWEFPLHVMDGYVMFDNLSEAQHQTITALQNAENKGVSYFTFLFHDYMFNPKTYPNDKQFYEWFVNYCQQNNYEFISYREAIIELESSNH